MMGDTAVFHRSCQLLKSILDSSWNVMSHGDARLRKRRGNWRMQWVASTLHTTSEHGVSSITTADAHTSAASNRLNWLPSADLNGLVRFAERRNLVSARVPSHFNWPLPQWKCTEWGKAGTRTRAGVGTIVHWLLDYRHGLAISIMAAANCA